MESDVNEATVPLSLDQTNFDSSHLHSLVARQQPIKSKKSIFAGQLDSLTKKTSFTNILHGFGLFAIITISIIPTFLILFILYPFTYVIRRFLLGISRTFDTYICWISKGNRLSWRFPSRLATGTELYWLNQRPGVSIVMLQFSSSMTVEKIKNAMKKHFTSNNNTTKDIQFTKMKEKLIKKYFGFVWTISDNFLLENHIHEISSGEVTSIECMYRYMGNLLCTEIELSRPLWDVFYKPKCGKNDVFVVVFRYHACIGDGISLMKALLGVADKVPVLLHQRPRFGSKTYMYSALIALVLSPSVLMSSIYNSHQLSVRENMLVQKSQESRPPLLVEVCTPMDMLLMEKTRLIAKATINEVLLCIVAGGLRRFFKARGVAESCDLNFLISVDLRKNEQDTQAVESFQINHRSSFISLLVPTCAEGFIPRLWAVQSRSKSAKFSAEIALRAGVLNILSVVQPMKVTNALFNALDKGVACQFANIEAPPISLAVNGSLLLNLMSWQAPLTHACLSLNVVTYADSLQLTLCADPTLVGGREAFQAICSHINEEIAYVSDVMKTWNIPLAAASKLRSIIQQKMTLMNQLISYRERVLQTSLRPSDETGESTGNNQETSLRPSDEAGQSMGSHQDENFEAIDCSGGDGNYESAANDPDNHEPDFVDV